MCVHVFLLVYWFADVGVLVCYLDSEHTFFHPNSVQLQRTQILSSGMREQQWSISSTTRNMLT